MCQTYIECSPNKSPPHFVTRTKQSSTKCGDWPKSMEPGFKPTQMWLPTMGRELSLFKATATQSPSFTLFPSSTPTGSSPPPMIAPLPIAPCLPVFIIHFLLLCFTLMGLGKRTRQMGKEVEILCNITKLVLSASPRDLLELVRRRWG